MKKDINKTWKTINKETLIKDQWISLTAETCLLPDNTIIEPYYLLEYPPWVNVVAVTENNNIILVKQYRHGINKTIIELPSGSFDNIDKDPSETARRELLEETGYTGDVFELISVKSPNPANHTNLVYSYLVRNIKKVAEQDLDISEDIEIIKLPVKDVINMLINNEFYQAMHVSALFYALLKLDLLKVI